MTSQDQPRTTKQSTALPSAVVAAVVFMFVAGILSSVLHVGVRFLSQRLPTIEIVFLRTALSMLVMFPFIIVPGRAAWRTSKPGMHLFRGVVSVLSMSMWYHALATMPLADATALGMTTSIFVVLGAAFWFREQVGIERWLAVLIGLLGAIVVLRPGSGVISWSAIAAIASSALWAWSLLMMKALARYESPLTVTFYQPLAIAPLAGIATIGSWVTPNLTELTILIGMAAAASGSNYCATRALHLADASITSPIDYMKLLWTVTWGYALFGEIPAVSTWAGAALIIGASVYIAVVEHSRRRGP